MKWPRFRFGVRGLLIAVTVAGIGVSAFARIAARAKAEANLVAQLKQYGFLPWYEPRCAWLFGTRGQPGFWRRWLGDDISDTPQEIIGRACVFDFDDPLYDDLTSAIPLLRQLPERFTLTVSAGSVGPGDIAELKRIPNLERFSVRPDPPNAPHRWPDFAHWDPFRHLRTATQTDSSRAGDSQSPAKLKR